MWHFGVTAEWVTTMCLGQEAGTHPAAGSTPLLPSCVYPSITIPSVYWGVLIGGLRKNFLGVSVLTSTLPTVFCP